MKQMKERNIVFDISDLPLDTPAEVNIARRRLEETMAQTDEINYAADQKNRWQEISDYMSLLIKGGGKKEYDDDNVIEVPKDETPAYLEWTLWRAALAIDHLVNKPYEVRGFRLDSDFMPVSAAGGKGDLYCEFENFTILTEVTMSTSSRQEAMEGEPVRRHVSDAVLAYSKPVYGMFIAVRIDTNTAETFRHGVWYAKGDERQRLNIVPISLAQFQVFFERMFKTNQASPEKLVELIEYCSSKRDVMEAPAWKDHIDSAIRVGIYAQKIATLYKNTEATRSAIYDLDSVNKAMMVAEDTVHYGKKHDFPYGIFFGSRIKDTVKNRIGCVVGIKEDYILVAFEGEVEPQIVPVKEDSFDKGFFSLA